MIDHPAPIGPRSIMLHHAVILILLAIGIAALSHALAIGWGAAIGTSIDEMKFYTAAGVIAVVIAVVMSWSRR